MSANRRCRIPQFEQFEYKLLLSASTARLAITAPPKALVQTEVPKPTSTYTASNPSVGGQHHQGAGATPPHDPTPRPRGATAAVGPGNSGPRVTPLGDPGASGASSPVTTQASQAVLTTSESNDPSNDMQTFTARECPLQNDPVPTDGPAHDGPRLMAVGDPDGAQTGLGQRLDLPETDAHDHAIEFLTGEPHPLKQAADPEQGGSKHQAQEDNQVGRHSNADESEVRPGEAARELRRLSFLRFLLPPKRRIQFSWRTAQGRLEYGHLWTKNELRPLSGTNMGDGDGERRRRRLGYSVDRWVERG
jgi:hypothetical protein